ncbi:murein hydrolase activator EnvC family protein [Leeuwenhoekiella marinoflava]|uniref:Septal ring factor EnvC (AmiA/AmiB activator) n=2 Tax=Leeuwenhoekiella marinoflava TaxID=988 RepID=A0A4Q0PRN9_9FLAO|nr:peptidoglycan DD-metalloendopeptidase family protein [Leeuwenhoekiella marinoflava]RXG32922.1 septal ring factor EnvC (AmiA/AmiB activator) [Leeuwenhoekiella marinoflava]SHE32062.1 Septal ring factor EnvC, activator of murein hydrolases AmiA and AmiB [Leeuwenhoekiella marinoflava DSM 3653]
MQLKQFYTFSLLIFLFLGGSANLWSQNDKQADLERQRRALMGQIEQLSKLRQSNKKKEQNVLNQVEDLDSKIKTRENLIKVTNSQANLLTQKINQNINRISALRDELAKLKDDYAAMVQKSYKSKSSQSRIMFLLSSESFLQAYKRVQYMKQYSNYRKKQGDQIKERTALLQETNTKLIDQKEQKQQLIAQNKIEQKRLQEEKKQQDELIATIREKESTYVAQINKKQAEANRIDKEIDRLIREAIAASKKESGATASEKTATAGTMPTFSLTPAAKALASDFASNKGRMDWPVERGRVYKKFGTSQHPTLPNITTYNSGVEIETASGSVARAAFKGTVQQIQLIRGGGYTVLIRHGNYLTVYQNLKNLKVNVNDKVSTKQVLGEIAENSFSGKTILKFLVYKDSERLNPADWVYNM